MNEWKINLIKNKIKGKRNSEIAFIHTPKCGGTYSTIILKHNKFITRGHNQAKKSKNIKFTIIRDPIKRFESFLNYRLSNKRPRPDWPGHLLKVFSNKSISLNEIIEKMSDRQILNFKPYRNLVYWTKNIDFCLTIDELPEFIELCNGQMIDIPPANVSKKNRGTLNEANIERLKKIFAKDIEIYEKWTQ